ncbi:9495_t:CDS:2, partial [Cetraspora pellucida]
MYFGIKHEDKAELDNPILFQKGRIIKKNATNFYRTVTTDIIWSVLEFENQKEILMNDEKSIEQIISEVVKKYNDETDLKLFKLTDKYNPDFKHPSLTDFANRNFQPVKKGGNLKMWPCSKLKEKQKIDYLYYFKSLRDICASLLKKEKEETEQFLEVIYNENLKCSRQTTLVDLWYNVEQKL